MWPFTTTNPYQHPLPTLRAQYDYIVVGGGTSGCAVARRLAEDNNSTVLLIERGDAGDSWLHRTPLTSGHFFSDGKHSMVCDSIHDDRFGRSFPLITGLGLGGTSRINGGQYTCGVPAQFTSWAQEGRVGWSYVDIKPYLDKSEHWTGLSPNEYHGLNGPLQVRSFERYAFEANKIAAEAMQRMGYHDIVDMHSPLEPSIGFNKMHYAIDPEGRRSSSFRAYLPNSVVKQYPNLHVCTKIIACRLELSEGSDGAVSAAGVVVQPVGGGSTRVITARREIVLSCGALRTPQLLMLSGVGPEEHLQKMGIRLVKHLPGVGQPLRDHILLSVTYKCPLSDSLWAVVRRPTSLVREIYKYIAHGVGWLLSTLVEVEAFGISSLVQVDGSLSPHSEEHLDPCDPKNLPDFSVMGCPIADPSELGSDKSKGIFALNVALLLAKSGGQVQLRSLDPRADPLCELRYLSAPEDLVALRAGVRTAVAIAREMRAGGYPLEDATVPDISSDAALDKFIRERLGSMFHYSSTCRMAPENDEHPGVVDDSLRVYGIANLRIADASIFPDVPATHPQALVYAIAEKCADMIRKHAAVA